jgi:hypothetical protein
MKAIVLPGVASLSTLIWCLCVVLPASTQEKQVPNKPTVVHASVAAYPNAIISLKDRKTEMILYVESNGRTLVALGKDGEVVWSVDVLQEAKIKPATGQPVIRHLRLEGNDLSVTCGKSDTAKVQMLTGKIERVGAD